MTIETEDDVIALKRIGRIVSYVLHEMLEAAEPGMTTRELDSLGARLLEKHGAQSAPELTYGFPGATCISINEEAAHGIPGERVASREEYVTDLAVVPDGATLVLQAGKRNLSLKPDDLEHYKGERGRRGNKLPRGFQRVDALLVETAG